MIGDVALTACDIGIADCPEVWPEVAKGGFEDIAHQVAHPHPPQEHHQDLDGPEVPGPRVLT